MFHITFIPAYIFIIPSKLPQADVSSLYSGRAWGHDYSYRGLFMVFSDIPSVKFQNNNFNEANILSNSLFIVLLFSLRCIVCVTDIVVQ
jgi:hypothetical protein